MIKFDITNIVEDILEESLAWNNDSLYHSTDPYSAGNILQQGVMQGSTFHKAKVQTWFNETDNRERKRYNHVRFGNPQGAGGVRGNSLTRDMAFAKEWKPKQENIVLEFSREKIRHNNRISPVNYFTDNVWKHPKEESEEFVHGKLNSVNMALKAIHLHRSAYENIKSRMESLQSIDDERERVGDNRVFDDDIEKLDHVLSHPKLKIHDTWDY
jgi:hypothetical protein